VAPQPAVDCQCICARLVCNVAAHTLSNAVCGCAGYSLQSKSTTNSRVGVDFQSLYHPGNVLRCLFIWCLVVAARTSNRRVRCQHRISDRRPRTDMGTLSTGLFATGFDQRWPWLCSCTTGLAPVHSQNAGKTPTAKNWRNTDVGLSSHSLIRQVFLPDRIGGQR